MKIAVCHQTFSSGDAIGNDIRGMCRTLSACGHEPIVLCDHNPHGLNGCPVVHDFGDSTLSACDLLIYHHSQDWPRGRDLLHRYRRPVAFRFHNITPARFFAGYCAEYEETCRRGAELTELLAHWPQPHLWLSDSEYNQSDLLKAGADPAKCSVAAPFNHSERLLCTPNRANVSGVKARFLFVGRFAPNKGHLHLARFASAYRQLFGDVFEITIVGSIDPRLGQYWEEFASLVRALGIAEHIAVYPHASDQAVHELFHQAHAYLTFSEHEGFCVPVVEAQSIGLPVVGSGATAVRETAGPGQFLDKPPATPIDYEFYAELAHRAVYDREIREALVSRGYKNVMSRFSHAAIENAFLTPLVPWFRLTL